MNMANLLKHIKVCSLTKCVREKRSPTLLLYRASETLKYHIVFYSPIDWVCKKSYGQLTAGVSQIIWRTIQNATIRCSLEKDRL